MKAYLKGLLSDARAQGLNCNVLPSKDKGLPVSDRYWLQISDAENERLLIECQVSWKEYREAYLYWQSLPRPKRNRKLDGE